MIDGADIPPAADEPDPELVELMRERVVRRKSTRPKNPKPGPGRPKGCTKPPGSGKRAGTPNLMSPEFREWLAKKAKPFELLATITRGGEFMDGDVKRRPTAAERMRAAETLLRKLAPDLQASKVEASGPGGVPLATLGLGEDADMVHRVMFMAEQRRRASAADGVGGDGGRVVDAVAVVDDPAPETARLGVGHVEHHGPFMLRLAERLPDRRERWVALDGAGTLVATAFGRDALRAKLELPERRISYAGGGNG